MEEHFDVIIIGGGAAGFAAAERASQRDARVCLIEKERLGGECPNWACIPTKALLRSAKLYHAMKHEVSDMGVLATDVRFQYRRILDRKDAIVKAVTGGGKRFERRADELGITVVRGRAAFVDSHSVRVGRATYRGDSIILATGSTPFIPPVEGLNEVGYWTFREAVEEKNKPDSLFIIGGGPVGIEFATFFGLLETKVIVAEVQSQILGHEDAEIAAIAQKQLQDVGISVNVHTKVLSVERVGKKKRVTFQVGDKPRESVLVDEILVTTGKRAQIEGLHLEAAGVDLDDRGRLQTDAYLRTNVHHIFAAGDVNGGMMYTHMAHHEGVVAAENAFPLGQKSLRSAEVAVIPRVTFCFPEVASVGMTTAEAVEKGVEAGEVTFSIGSLARALTDGRRVGKIKITFDKKSRRIIGGHIVGPHAGEMIHEIALALQLDASLSQVAQLMHAFPTYSEGIAAALTKFE